MSELVFDALEYAARAHRGQFRKGTHIPALSHPLNAARILVNYEQPDDVVAAALLHDTIEDTDATGDEIEERFGVDVRVLVEAASEPDKSLPWRARKEHTHAFLRSCPERQLLVPMADKLDNMRNLREQLGLRGEVFFEIFNSDLDQQRWYYAVLAEIFTERFSGTPLAPLAEEYAGLVEKNYG